MDAELNRRWRAGDPPFDGFTLRYDEELPIAILRPVLLAVVHNLFRDHASAPLYVLQDWHEHDGYINSPEPTDWASLLTVLSSDQALLASSTRETFVSLGYFIEARDFYLRYLIPDESDWPPDCDSPIGSFDFTSDELQVDRARQAIELVANVPLIKEPAKQYFDRRYAG